MLYVLASQCPARQQLIGYASFMSHYKAQHMCTVYAMSMRVVSESFCISSCRRVQQRLLHSSILRVQFHLFVAHIGALYLCTVHLTSLDVTSAISSSFLSSSSLATYGAHRTRLPEFTNVLFLKVHHIY